MQYPVLVIPWLLLVSLSSWGDTAKVTGLEFDRVLVQGGVEVQISQGDTTEMLLRGTDDDLAKEPFFITDGTLVLGSSRKFPGEKFAGVQFKLLVTALSNLQLKGSGDVYLNPIKSDELNVALTGSGDIRLFDVDAPRLALRLNGSGDIQMARAKTAKITLLLVGSGDIYLDDLAAQEVEATIRGSGDISLQGRGSAEILEINIVGSGDADFNPLKAVTARINIAGSGGARVGIIESLEANIMGSGDVSYRGKPDIDQTILGSGELYHER